MKNFVYCLAAIVLSACSKPAAEIIPENTGPVRDSVEFSLHLKRSGWAQEVRHTDVFAYDSDGVRPLVYHERYEGLPEELSLRLPEGGKIFAAVGNCPFGFNLKALEKFDSMELLTFNLSDEDRDAPLMSAWRNGEGVLELSPLLCRITLAEVSNALDNYVLLEDPRVYLTGVNPLSEVFREEEFRPREEAADTVIEALPCDVGFYTQEPETRLYCYPNDTPEDLLGYIRTEFTMECRIEGETYRYRITLPPFGRGADLRLKLDVTDPETFYWKVE